MRLLLPLTTIFASVALVAAMLAPFVATAQAQTPSAAPSVRQVQNPSAAIPDDKLDRVAAAAKRVNMIGSSYKQKLALAPVSEKQRISDEASSALAKAINDQGLSVDEYESIMLVAENNLTVRNKILDRMR